VRIGEAGTEGTADACDLERDEYAQPQTPLSMTDWWWFGRFKKAVRGLCTLASPPRRRSDAMLPFRLGRVRYLAFLSPALPAGSQEELRRPEDTSEC